MAGTWPRIHWLHTLTHSLCLPCHIKIFTWRRKTIGLCWCFLPLVCYCENLISSVTKQKHICWLKCAVCLTHYFIILMDDVSDLYIRFTSFICYICYYCDLPFSLLSNYLKFVAQASLHRLMRNNSVSYDLVEMKRTGDDKIKETRREEMNEWEIEAETQVGE